MNNQTSLEKLLLKAFMEEAVEAGISITYKRLYVNDNLLKKININNKTKATLKELEEATNKCIAFEWVERHQIIGNTLPGNDLRSQVINAIKPEQYYLTLTNKGYEEADALIHKDKRTKIKKISDYLEYHKGLFYPLAGAASILAIWNVISHLK
ncbi:MAG: hypothetical protein PHY54_04705 [Methylococcales bacterium]|nr:hypothetical protein [Methylococcales bacterium]